MVGCDEVREGYIDFEFRNRKVLVMCVGFGFFVR